MLISMTHFGNISRVIPTYEKLPIYMHTLQEQQIRTYDLRQRKKTPIRTRLFSNISALPRQGPFIQTKSGI